jgi:ribosome biogenesis GTPase
VRQANDPYLSNGMSYRLSQSSSELRDIYDAVIALNGRSADAVALLRPWLGKGQTIALVGSSGVGKSTLVNTLTGSHTKQKTGTIREYDAQGRHTTTARSLHAVSGGGWVIDTPGIRKLYVSDVTNGIDTLFAEITELAPLCRFRDCTHAHEPGCAVQGAVARGELGADRLERWRGLHAENADRTPVVSGPRGNKLNKKKHYLLRP